MILGFLLAIIYRVGKIINNVWNDPAISIFFFSALQSPRKQKKNIIAEFNILLQNQYMKAILLWWHVSKCTHKTRG